MAVSVIFAVLTQKVSSAAGLSTVDAPTCQKLDAASAPMAAVLVMVTAIWMLGVLHHVTLSLGHHLHTCYTSRPVHEPRLDNPLTTHEQGLLYWLLHVGLATLVAATSNPSSLGLPGRHGRLPSTSRHGR